MNRLLYFVANVIGGIVLVLVVIDPTRPLLPIVILLGLGCVLALIPRFLPPRK